MLKRLEVLKAHASAIGRVVFQLTKAVVGPAVKHVHYYLKAFGPRICPQHWAVPEC